jgi:hypothetical protein
MVATEHNRGFAAGIGKRSRVQQLAWALKGAPMRRKDLRLNAMAGIAEGRKLRDKVTRLMLEANADPGDAMVMCVFAEPDLSALIKEVLYLPPVQKMAAEIKLAESVADKLPIGFLVFVWDRSDPQKSIFGHARPLIVEDPRGPVLNELALYSYTRKIEAKLMSDGVIPDQGN